MTLRSPAVSRALRPAALLVAAAALSAFTILREIGPHDEGLMLQAAARVAGGEWPYRDFWSNYGPGQPLALAVALGGGGWRALGAAVAVAVAAWAPFLVAAPHDTLADTVGFLGVQHLQHLPLALRHHGGADPNKLLEFYFPALLLAGCALWVARRRALWLAPLVLTGALYLYARPDEFHLVPLSAVLAVALALAAAREPSRAWRAA